jgi:hypothetical protein
MPTKQIVVTTWLTDIASSFKPSLPAKELAARIQLTARSLRVLYPAEAFTFESANAIKNGLDEFPAGIVIADRLAAWWKDRKTGPSPATDWPGSEDSTLTREDQIKLSVWLKHRAEGFTHINLADFHNRMAQSLSSHRQYSPRVFAHICRTDAEAERIALHRGWLEDASERGRERTEAEKARASAVVAEAIAAMRAGPLYRKAHTVEDQQDAVETPPKPIERSRADDLSLLASLRSDPRVPGRAYGIAALCQKLNVAQLATDPQAEPVEVFTEPEPPPEPRKPTEAEIIEFAKWRAPWDIEEETEHAA